MEQLAPISPVVYYSALSQMKSLFDKTKAGAIVLKNRFVRASVGDHVKDGFVSAAMIEKYEALARGGVSTILSGYTLVDGNEHGHGITAMWLSLIHI